jgi:hypothetical protein
MERRLLLSPEVGHPPGAQIDEVVCYTFVARVLASREMFLSGSVTRSMMACLRSMSFVYERQQPVFYLRLEPGNPLQAVRVQRLAYGLQDLALVTEALAEQAKDLASARAGGHRWGGV